MNIHEYQAKELLAQHGVAVPSGHACQTVEEALEVAKRLFDEGHSMIVIKSQIHAGGRGKGTFKSGFQGPMETRRNRCFDRWKRGTRPDSQNSSGGVPWRTQTGPKMGAKCLTLQKKWTRQGLRWVRIGPKSNVI